MRILFTCLALLLMSSLSVGQRFAVVPGESILNWQGAKVTGTHTGNVGVKAGTITMNGDLLGAADVTVDMRSITCTDIANEGSNAKLVTHLRSADFFAVEDHPEAMFRTTRVEIAKDVSGAPLFIVIGDLTIKGISQPVSFPCTVRNEGAELRASAILEFDRSKYDIRYRSGSFFEGLGDRMIHDMVTLSFELIAR